jgi:hypothetical protein
LLVVVLPVLLLELVLVQLVRVQALLDLVSLWRYWRIVDFDGVLLLPWANVGSSSIVVAVGMPRRLLSLLLRL